MRAIEWTVPARPLSAALGQAYFRGNCGEQDGRQGAPECAALGCLRALPYKPGFAAYEVKRCNTCPA